MHLGAGRELDVYLRPDHRLSAPLAPAPDARFAAHAGGVAGYPKG